jgi:hypothetical protein
VGSFVGSCATPQDKPLTRGLLYPSIQIHKVVEEEEEDGSRSQSEPRPRRMQATASLTRLLDPPGHESLVPQRIMQSAFGTSYDPRYPPESAFDGRDGASPADLMTVTWGHLTWLT